MSDGTRTIAVDHLARVEGEGALTLRYRGEAIETVELRIFEPPRFFEAFLRGRSALEAPDITARICGICPVAYLMSACAAVEGALGVQISDNTRHMRQLLYAGEWIESHALHMVMLHAPDFLGVADVMELARDHGPLVKAGLRVKKAGNAAVALSGGREVHPINVKVGGFYKLPDRARLDALAAEMEACIPLAEALLRWVATFHFPDLERPSTWLAVHEDGAYPFMGDQLISSAGHRFPVADFPGHVVEEHVARSNALHARLDGLEDYQVGPLARYNLGFDKLPDNLKRLADELGILPPIQNPFRSILVRGIEVLYALQQGAAAARAIDASAAPNAPVTLREGLGHGVTEAPRGTLYHRYDIGPDGLIRFADIVPPTSQNQRCIEADLRALAPRLRTESDAVAKHLAEQAIRNYDPCISCATHFLDLQREQLA